MFAELAVANNRKFGEHYKLSNMCLLSEKTILNQAMKILAYSFAVNEYAKFALQMCNNKQQNTPFVFKFYR